ncbi:L-rhamnose-binding lectin CSL1-like [Danio aesculapii]|uniref:L-rhamnose-binding lectin CSL1-like n=1 Tax=Danio aesculapii TaxID=1142201 RepID=UPI0024C05B71|nr:L-rhamnose-binding lectin CSL1-like [Danio aesculapii]
MNCSLLISADTKMTCENSDFHLRCETGVIFVKSVTFGRQSTHTCGLAGLHSDLVTLRCLKDVPFILKFWCNGHAECLLSKKTVAGSDACFYTYKYYNTTYTCILTKTCEICKDGHGVLKCEHGKIKIIAADYQHRDKTTCLEGPPFKREQNTDCYSTHALSLVSESCEGREHCFLSGTGEIFNDPCYGINKYLHISYFCESDES